MADVKPDQHRFVFFSGVPVPIKDVRGQEELIDRAWVGGRLGSHGHQCTAIVLLGSWFEIQDESGAIYRVPVTNVGSARR